MTTHNIPTEVPFVDMNYSLETIIHLLTVENLNLKQQIRGYQEALDQAHREINNLDQALAAANKATERDFQEKHLIDNFDLFNLRRKLEGKPTLDPGEVEFRRVEPSDRAKK